jgi:hypothetical protein
MATPETRWAEAPKGILTTGIGSLPHASMDAALEYAFRSSLPFLPQMPVRNAREYMIVQALEGMPGLQVREKGESSLDRREWAEGQAELADALDKAFRAAKTLANAFESFEPGDAWSCWQPFLWEVGERKIKLAKIQISGPMTCQWALRLSDGSPADSDQQVSTQIFRLVLARALAMVRKLRAQGVMPLLFLDEPGFYCFSKTSPRHLLGLQELKIVIQTLKKEEALVGLHCCSNTDWSVILGLDLDVLSIDGRLSLGALLTQKEAIQRFVREGGRLSLGVIPTGLDPEAIEGFSASETIAYLTSTLRTAGFAEAEQIRNILSRSLYTPACGLALHRVEDAEKIQSDLGEMAKVVTELF